jgi:hypothetical protein
VKEEVKREIRKYIDTNENVKTYKNLWGTTQAIPREFIAINANIKK